MYSSTLERLQAHGVATGLARIIAADSRRVARRIYLLDNSASSLVDDGSVLEQDHESGFCGMRSGATRWEENCAFAMMHALWSQVVGTPCEFLLLHAPPDDGSQVPADAQAERREVLMALRARLLQGAAPASEECSLSQRLRGITEGIGAVCVEELRAKGQVLVVVLVVHAMPGDEEAERVAEALEGLRDRVCRQLRVVVRVCGSSVADVYERLGVRVGVPFEVVRSIHREAAAVAGQGNGWFVYASVLHRMREAGATWDPLRAMRRRRLTGEEAHHLAAVLLERRSPIEGANIDDFLRAAQLAAQAEPAVFDARCGGARPPVDVGRLGSALVDAICRGERPHFLAAAPVLRPIQPSWSCRRFSRALCCFT